MQSDFPVVLDACVLANGRVRGLGAVDFIQNGLRPKRDVQTGRLSQP
jgi:hypothetical protein